MKASWHTLALSSRIPSSIGEAPPSKDSLAGGGGLVKLVAAVGDNFNGVDKLRDLTGDVKDARVETGSEGKEISTTSILVATRVSFGQGAWAPFSNGMVVGKVVGEFVRGFFSATFLGF